MTAAVGQVRHCARCGYDLRGLRDARCPECGLRFDPAVPPQPDIPWLRRRQIGRFAAYCRTVWLVLARPERFAAQAWWAAQIDESDAESFRRVTVAIAVVSIAFTIAAVAVAHLPGAPRAATILRDMTFATCITAPAVGVFLAIATVPTPIAPPHTAAGRVVGRTTPLRKFCCAGLALSPFVALATAATAAVGLAAGHSNGAASGAVAGIGAVVVLLAWCGGSAAFLLRHVGWGLLTILVLSMVWWACALLASFLTLAFTARLVRLLLR